MRIDDVLGDGQGQVVAHAGGTFGVLDHRTAMRRMLAHLLELFLRQRARLVEDRIRNANLADVVKRREAGEQLDALGRQIVLKRRMP